MPYSVHWVKTLVGRDETVATELLTTLTPELRAEVDRYLEERMAQHVKELVRAELEADPARNMCRIIASKGTMDMAYPPLILASAAAAMGMDTAIFFTFYGLEMLKKNLKLKMDPIGNPAMPMPMPNLISVLPGMRSAATLMMGSMFKQKGVASLSELREACTDSGVRLVACRMTFDVMGYKEADLIEGCEFGGAAAFLSEAARAHVTLFI